MDCCVALSTAFGRTSYRSYVQIAIVIVALEESTSSPYSDGLRTALIRRRNLPDGCCSNDLSSSVPALGTSSCIGNATAAGSTRSHRNIRPNNRASFDCPSAAGDDTLGQ